MMEALKIIHLFCLYAAGGATIGSAVTMRSVMANGGPPPPAIAALTLATLGKVGAAAIVVVWITGVLLTLQGYGGGADLGWAFYAKVTCATLVLGAVAMLSITAAKAARAGTAPDPNRMKTFSMVAAAGTVLTVIFAVITFA